MQISKNIKKSFQETVVIKSLTDIEMKKLL